MQSDAPTIDTGFAVEEYRKDFPILETVVNKKPLVYLDNGATAHKPIQVINALEYYYKAQNSNIHRGVHTLSRNITIAYEEARKTVQQHLNAMHAYEIIFTSGTTASINLVAHSFAEAFLKAGDEIVISGMEHHSNILPWQYVAKKYGCKLQVIPVTEAGELDMAAYKALLNDKTKLVAVTHISNTLGTINPVREIIQEAKRAGALTLVDGAQSVPHMSVDVQDLDCDFFVFSGHKVFGPTGVGILYGKEAVLNQLPPYQYGGGIIKTVTFEETIFADLPLKFEAGTPHIEGGIGLAAALDYINNIGLDRIAGYEHSLLENATLQLLEIPEVEIMGMAKNKASVISFNVKGAHPFDVGTLLDQMGIAVRTGHHCTQPLMQRFGVPGTVRASFAFYNTHQEINRFIEGLKKSVMMLS